jgi:hypothetical protein
MRTIAIYFRSGRAYETAVPDEGLSAEEFAARLCNIPQGATFIIIGSDAVFLSEIERLKVT